MVQEPEQLFNWRNLFLGFEGRIDRSDFWCGALGLVTILLVISLCVDVLPVMAGDFFMGIAYTAAIYPAAALTVKRLQDRGKSAKLAYLFLGLPILVSVVTLVRLDPSNPVAVFLSALYVPVMLWALIELAFLQGTPGANDYGLKPALPGSI